MRDSDTIEEFPPDEESNRVKSEEESKERDSMKKEACRLEKEEGKIDYRRLLVQMRSVGVSLKQLCELPPGELALMITLAKWTNPGRQIRPSELGKEMRLSRPAVSRMLKSLKEKGYLEMSIQADDHRYVRVALTDKGRASLDHALFQCTGILSRVISRMGCEDLQRMLYYNDMFLSYLTEELQLS